jgi:hypothetical protein
MFMAESGWLMMTLVARLVSLRAQPCYLKTLTIVFLSTGSHDASMMADGYFVSSSPYENLRNSFREPVARYGFTPWSAEPFERCCSPTSLTDKLATPSRCLSRDNRNVQSEFAFDLWRRRTGCRHQSDRKHAGKETIERPRADDNCYAGLDCVVMKVGQVHG